MNLKLIAIVKATLAGSLALFVCILFIHLYRYVPHDYGYTLFNVSVVLLELVPYLIILPGVGILVVRAAKSNLKTIWDVLALSAISGITGMILILIKILLERLVTILLIPVDRIVWPHSQISPFSEVIYASLFLLWRALINDAPVEMMIGFVIAAIIAAIYSYYRYKASQNSNLKSSL